MSQPMSQPSLSLDELFAAHIQTLATTLRPNTVYSYRSATNNFLAYQAAENVTGLSRVLLSGG